MTTPDSREFKRRCLAALAGFGLVLFFFSPSWAAFALWSRVPELGGMIEVRRGAALLEQVRHLGAPVSDPLHQVLQWRLLFPAIGRALHLPAALLFALAPAGCLATLGYIVTLLRGRGFGWAETLAGSVCLGAGSWLFTSTGWLGYFDSWLALGLLLVAFARRPWTLWAAVLCGPWIDERFVAAAPLALFCRWIWKTAPPATDDIGGASLNATREFLVPVLLLGGFVLVRFGLLAGLSGRGATLPGYFAGHNYLDAPVERIALGIWEGLRGGWLFVVAAVWLRARGPGAAALLGPAVLVVLTIGLATAQDYSRSMTMLLPVAALGLLLAGPASHLLTSRPALLSAAAIALLLPAHHVMNDRVSPIFYLYHELAAFGNPPAMARPEVHELAGIHAMERGDLAEANAELSLAIRLAANPSSPARQRGILYASHGRWEDARRDFTTSVRHDPESADAWFMLAQADLAVGDPVTARRSFERARALAPADWFSRPDVGRFQTRLNASAARP